MLAILIRTVILYIVITVAIRLMGKRQIGDMQPNELVITLLISEIAAIPLQDSNQPIINGITAISVLIVAEITVSLLALKSDKLRRIIGGKAVVLIKNGVIDRAAMKKVRVTADDLLEMLRGKDVFDINEVDFAILEVNGELNVFLKDEYKNVTRKDLNIKPDAEQVLLPVIIDGSNVKDYYDYLGLNEETIKRALENNGISLKSTFLLLTDKSGNLTLIKKEKKE